MNIVIIKSIHCPICSEFTTFEATEEQARQWQDPRGPHVQDVFPELSADDRERLITGYCAPCWTSLFAEEDEERR
jgi:hypothetical protein